MSIRIALAATLALAAQPALSATLAEISGGFALSVPEGLPGGVEVLLDDPIVFSDTFEAPAPSAAEAEAEAQGDALAGRIAASAFTDGDGVALGEGLYVTSGLAENATGEPVSVSARVEYDLAAFAAIGDPERDDVIAAIAVELIVDEAQVLSEEVVRELAFPGEASLSDAFAYDLLLPAFGAAEFALSVEGFAFVAEPAPIPLPAGLPTLAAAVGALALLRRGSPRRA